MDSSFIYIFSNIIEILINLVDFAVLLIIIRVIISWLMTFDVVNVGNARLAQMIRDLERFTDFFLDPIRRVLPTIAGVDLSPLVLCVLLEVVKILLGALRLALPHILAA